MMDRMTTGLIAGGILGIAVASAAFAASDDRVRRNVMRKTRRIARRASHAMNDFHC